MARLGKRNRKFYGSRNHGKGNAKNRRGKGGKGGWGRAGMHKQRFSYITVYERDWMAHGGRFGFSNPTTADRLPTMNVYEIEQMAIKDKLEKKDGKLFVAFEGKVLGSGMITKAVHVRALSFSKGAIEKIKKAGGAAEAPEPVAEEKQEKKK
ncbi:50S ribosomal protein L15 [uncultured archaeon]|nr:50S ribosomal protein L15 [uncultured archaeon]